MPPGVLISLAWSGRQISDVGSGRSLSESEKYKTGIAGGRAIPVFILVEMRGIEPLTFALRTRRSPS